MFLDNTPLEERIYRGGQIDFLVLSRREIRDAAIDVPHVVISITNPDFSDAEIADSPHCRAVFRLKFDDWSEPDIPGLEDLKAEPNVPLTREAAQGIISFAESHLDDVELIVCHCEAGVSRSPAVAAALSRLLHDEDQFFFDHYWPNKWVYRTILDAAREALPS